jgi:uncharacterized membrane protein
MGSLLASAAVFLFLHRVISGSPLREKIVRRVGETAFGRLFQLASLVVLVWLGIAYAGAKSPEAVEPLWSVHPWARQVQVILQLLALLLIVAGLTTPNPGTFGQEVAADYPKVVHGILRVTRHPFLWGVALFAVGHIMAAPTLRNVILFGTLVFTSLTGTVSIDTKRRRKLGARWIRFAAHTSNIPFAAILTLRQPLRPSELGWHRIAFTLVLFAILLLTHSSLFGTPAV